MLIADFANPKHADLANNEQLLSRWCAKKRLATAQEVRAALTVLDAAPSLWEVPKQPFHPHPLHWEYKGCFAIWLNKKARVIFRPTALGGADFQIDNFKTIKAIIIEEICTDYHDR